MAENVLVGRVHVRKARELGILIGILKEIAPITIYFLYFTMRRIQEI